jgi:sortase B
MPQPAEFSYHEFVDTDDAAEFNDYVRECFERSFYSTGVSAKHGDKLITLSTCEYSQDDGRLVVVAKRV